MAHTVTIYYNGVYCFQLYSAGNESDRRSFLDSLFSYMQEQGERNKNHYFITYTAVLLFNTC